MAETALVLTELGALVLGLAVLARLAHRVGLTPIPLYLLAGLAFGTGGVVEIDLSEQLVELGSEIGVVLLLLTLGLEYTGAELSANLRSGIGAGLLDVVANLGPGVVAGLVLGWDPVAALLLGGVTYVSSSGIIAKVLSDLGRLGNRETPTLLSLLVLEDLAMAVYLPVVAVLLADEPLGQAVVAVVVAVVAVAVILTVAIRHGETLSRVAATGSDEALLLTVLGATLLVAGGAERLGVSAAVGAFLTGLALSESVAERASALVGPLRDLFAALFFVFFGLRIDPSLLGPALPAALALAVVTGLSKVGTGWWAARRAGIGAAGRMRTGTSLVSRGEFSIVIAGLGVVAGVEADLGPVAAAYVMLLAVAGPVLTRFSDRLLRSPAAT